MLRFLIQNIQAVLFIENFAFRNKLGIASRINEVVDNLFDRDPIMLDLPLEAPPEIPRIQLKDLKAVYSLNFSPIRIDFFYNEAGKPDKMLDSLREDFSKRLFKIVDLIKGEYHLTIPRIANVIKASSVVEGGSAHFIYDKFLRENAFFNNSFVTEIHSLEKTSMDDYHINRWFRIKTGETATQQDILSVEIDMNTLPDKPIDFDLNNIKDFFIGSFSFAKKNFADCFGQPL